MTLRRKVSLREDEVKLHFTLVQSLASLISINTVCCDMNTNQIDTLAYFQTGNFLVSNVYYKILVLCLQDWTNYFQKSRKQNVDCHITGHSTQENTKKTIPLCLSLHK